MAAPSDAPATSGCYGNRCASASGCGALTPCSHALASPNPTCINASPPFKTEGSPRMNRIVFAAVAIAASAAPALAQDVAAGENSFKKCLACHRVGADAKNLVGP